jgi:hypothetical protein
VPGCLTPGLPTAADGLAGQPRPRGGGGGGGRVLSTPPALAPLLTRPPPPPPHCAVRRARVQLPLTCGTEEIVDCAWVSAELTDDVPVMAAWIAVHSACDTFG